jgi:hypothetical protein
VGPIGGGRSGGGRLGVDLEDPVAEYAFGDLEVVIQVFEEGILSLEP